MVNIERDRYFMDIAFLVSKRSKCLSRQVGCVFVSRRSHIIATGYNGPPSKFPHCIVCVRKESGKDLDICHAIHAEMNAVLQCTDPYEIKQAYITTSPCFICTNLLLNTTCEEIIYSIEYPNPNAEIAWKRMGRIWRKI